MKIPEPAATLLLSMFRLAAHRTRTIVLVVVAILFSQLALATYVCPAAAVAADSVPMDMAPGEPCTGMADEGGGPMDQDQPNLCHQHWVNAAQSFDPVQSPVASLPAVIQVLQVPSVLDAESVVRGVFVQARQMRPPPDPLFLSTRRLRV